MARHTLNAPHPSRGVLRFDRFELRCASNELFKEGSRIKLKPQAVRVLALLAQRAGEAVAREEIRELLWGRDTFVDFDQSLNSCVTQLRSVLGDDPAAPRFIETLPKHGYRFIAPLTTEEEEALRPRRPRPVRLALVLVTAAVVLVGALFWSAGTRPQRTMLLVRPFENLGGGEDEAYIGEGLAEELITQIAGIAPRELGVYARSTAIRFQEASGSRYLNLDYIVEGSFRREGDRIRITARLIDAGDGASLWTEVYERSAADLLKVQTEVAARVSASLLPEVAPDAVESYRGSTSVAAAHQAYLEGRHHLAEMSREGFRRAVEAFERAVALDPGYARAWAGLADSFNLQPWWGGMHPQEAARSGREAAERALAIDPLLAEGHDALGFVHFYYDFDVGEAERRFRRALELEPGLAMTHYWYAGLLSASGRHPEAIASIRRAQEIDPLSPLVNADAGWYYFYARRYPEAIQECRRILGLEPSYAWAHSCVIDAALEAGRDDDARRGLEDLAGILPDPDGLRNILRTSATAKEAGRTFARSRLERENTGSEEVYRSSFFLALWRIRAGDAPGALDALEKAYEERDGFLVHLGVDPRLDPLRGEERFQRVLGKLGLAAGE